MNSLELIDKRSQLEKELENIINNGEKEERKLNDGEINELENIKKQINDIDEELRAIEIKNKENEKRNSSNNKMEKFSLLKAINDIANNRQVDERAMEVINEGMEEMRKAGVNYSGQIVLPFEERANGDAVVASIATYGKEAVATDKFSILEPLYANLVMTQAGATLMTGLVGDVSIPQYSGANVGWKGEVAAAAKGNGTFSEITLSPKRLTAYIDISKQFLTQDSVSAEELIRADIVRAVSQKLEETILGNEAGTTDKPAGLFNGIASGDTITPTYKEIVKMVADLEDADVVGDYKFIMNPQIKAALKTTSKDSGSGRFLMEGNEVDGIKALTTTNAKGIALANWSDYVIASWGGVDLTVDPYTQAANGMVRLVVNAYFDAKPRRTESFVKRTLKTA